LRNALTVAVLVVWMAMMALLVQRQMPPASTSLNDVGDLAALPPAHPPSSGAPHDATDPIDAGAPSGAAPHPGGATPATEQREEWFSVMQSGRKIGWARHVVERDRVSGDWIFHDDSGFTLAMLGVPQTLRTAMRARTNSEYDLESFDFQLLSPAARFRATGTSDGRKLALHYGPEGTEHTAELPLVEPIHLPTTLRPRILGSRPKDGARFTASVFSPLTMKSEPLVFVVEGRETLAGPDGPVEALRIAEEHQGIKTRAWLAPDGSVLREEGTLGFTLERAPAETALAGIEQDAPIDLALVTRIPVEGGIASPREASTLTLRVSGPAADRIPSDPPRQRVVDGRLHLVRETVPDDLPLGLPPPGATDASVEGFLDPSPFIESDDPAIVGTARAIVGGERDPVRVAHLLLDWVSENLVQEPSMTVPSARAVLTARRGDCNEHAVLLTALARAAGIPARVAAGAMYDDGGFFYHAWSEFWLGRWVSADAVFRQMPADVTHVKLVEGGPERHLALAEVVGQLSFATEGDGS
jgi:Transglutaminase-like superfamily